VSRWVALLAAAAVALIVLWPVLAHPDRDGFPLSTYPMFSTRRTGTEPLYTVVGIDPDGAQEWLDPRVIDGTAEVVQAAVVVESEVVAGHADRLCAEVARRLSEAGGARLGRLSRLEVIRLRYDAVAYFSDRSEPPLERVVAASCLLHPR
jgi:hypothetical protein